MEGLLDEHKWVLNKPKRSEAKVTIKTREEQTCVRQLASLGELLNTFLICMQAKYSLERLIQSWTLATSNMEVGFVGNSVAIYNELQDSCKAFIPFEWNVLLYVQLIITKLEGVICFKQIIIWSLALLFRKDITEEYRVFRVCAYKDAAWFTASKSSSVCAAHSHLICVFVWRVSALM